MPFHKFKSILLLTVVVNVQEEYNQVESKARASKSAKEVGKTRQLRTELSTSAEAYPEKEHLAKLLKDLNTIRDSKRRLSGISKKEKKVKVEEAIQVAG